MEMTSLCFLLITLISVNCLKLEEVFVLSRHNLRAPLTDKLQKWTPLQLPQWDTEVGHLTPKGILLEQYMGEYFNQWLRKEGLFTNDCPETDEVLIYTNTYHRTKETGRSFAKSAFNNCNVIVLYKNTTEVDPLFHPIIRNNTTVFKESYVKGMQEKLDNLDLTDVYIELDNIIDLKNSDMCKSGSFCDLMNTKDVILFKVGDEPNVFGPLSIGNSFADFFLMEYYSGKPAKGIAWGKITNEEQWIKLLRLTKENQNVRFNYTLSNDLVEPILNYMKDTLIRLKPSTRKFTMLVGHDSNLNSVMASMEFKNFDLTGQYELTPIGGKIVFQKWRDENDSCFMKIEYVYQTKEKLRSGSRISLKNPPQIALMEMKGCALDERGFCPWSDFVNVLKKLTS